MLCVHLFVKVMARDLGGAINVADAFRLTVRVASLVPIDYKSVKYKSKLPEQYLLLRRIL